MSVVDSQTCRWCARCPSGKHRTRWRRRRTVSIWVANQLSDEIVVLDRSSGGVRRASRCPTRRSRARSPSRRRARPTCRCSPPAAWWSSTPRRADHPRGGGRADAGGRLGRRRWPHLRHAFHLARRPRRGVGGVAGDVHRVEDDPARLRHVARLGVIRQRCPQLRVVGRHLARRHAGVGDGQEGRHRSRPAARRPTDDVGQLRARDRLRHRHEDRDGDHRQARGHRQPLAAGVGRVFAQRATTATSWRWPATGSASATPTASST